MLQIPPNFPITPRGARYLPTQRGVREGRSPFSAKGNLSTVTVPFKGGGMMGNLQKDLKYITLSKKRGPLSELGLKLSEA